MLLHTELPLLYQSDRPHKCWPLPCWSDRPILVLHGVYTTISAFSDGRAVLYRYLYTELSDPSFGDRASAVLGRFREADPASEAMAGLAIQGQMMAQLSYIVDQLKASHRLGHRLGLTGLWYVCCGISGLVLQAWS